jgi:hypothetical protein
MLFGNDRLQHVAYREVGDVVVNDGAGFRPTSSAKAAYE